MATSERLSRRAARWLPLVASAALVALALHAAIDTPWLALVLAAIAAAIAVPALLERRRLRRLLTSGDADAVLAAWSRALDELPHRDTMAPLVAATALAANGQTERARTALARASRGRAWESAVEQRLFVETLLDAIEGQRERALSSGARLVRLPLPSAGPLLSSRVQEMRAAVAALARAFAHCTDPDDVALLERLAERAPLLHWALRYDAAVARIDRGERQAARRLLDGAPAWPADSAFSSFHAELSHHAADTA